MSEIMHCWPKEWVDAAVQSGLANNDGDGRYTFGSNELRDKMAKFAELIIEAVVKEEVEACAKICEEFEDDMGHGLPQHCANKIRARNHDA